MNIENHIKLGKGYVFHYHTPFKNKSENFHFIALGISIGKKGFALFVFGFSFGLGWNEY